MHRTAYRARFYDTYVSGRGGGLCPTSVAELRPRSAYLKRLIRDHFPADREATVLDLGCGHGALLHFARQLGYRNLRGVDGSREQVDVAARLGIRGVEHGDLMQVLAAQGDASVDCIVAFDVIEHLFKDELLLFVDEVRRVLVPQGRLIVHTVNGESPFAGRVRYGDLTHELAFTRPSIAQLLSASGFSEVRCYEDRPIPHGLKSAVRWALWRLIRGALRVYLAAESGDSGRDALFSQNFLTVAETAPK
jgi:SAM-dependent methyltransferase